MCYLLKLDITVRHEEVDYKNCEFFTNEDELLEDYFVTLYRNGQIYGDYSLVDCGEHRYNLFVNVPDPESIDKKFNNEYVNRSYIYMDIKTEILGKNILYYSNCSCKQIPFYVLRADADSDECSSPVTCGKCGGDIPLYKIPYLFNEKEHYSLIEWQKTYASVYELWIQSLSDRFVKNQILNPKSALNKLSFDVRRELEDKLKKPVYFSFDNAIGYNPKNKKDEKQVCPICGKALSDYPYKIGLVKMLKCDDCRISLVAL